MPTATGTLESLTSLIGQALLPVQVRLQPGNVVSYFAQLGTRFPDSLATDPDVSVSLGTASSAAGGISGFLTALTNAQLAGDDLGVVAAGVQIAGAISSLTTALQSAATTIGGKAWPPLSASQVQDFVASLPSRVVEDSLVRHLEGERTEFLSAATLIGVVDRFRTPVVGDANARPTFPRRLQLGRLTDLLSAPGDYLKGLVGWGDSTFDPTRLLLRVQAFLDLFGAGTKVGSPGGAPTLESLLLKIRGNAATVPPGIALDMNVEIPSGFGLSEPVSPGFDVNVTTTGTLPLATTIAVNPPSALSIASPVAIRFESQLRRTPVSPDTSIVIIGQTGATRLQADAVVFSAGFETKVSGTQAAGDIFVSIELVNGKAVIDFGGGDGFLKSIVSGKKLEADFDAKAIFSVASGLTFEAGAALKIAVPLHLSFAGVQVNNLVIALPIGAPNRPGLPFDVATALTTSFGPFTMVVDGVGLELDVAFGSGNVGIANITPGFKFPTGIGLSLDGPGGVSGGGFLSFDKNLGRYSGSIELQVFGIGVKAFGLLQTKFPDGRDGFSFVVVISTEFTPLQIGFGFTLNGVGGLLGLNRALVVEALSDAIRNGSVEHLLFPRDPVRDAPTILNDLESIYPATAGHQVVGPMAKLGWGTPTLITAELGIVIELPGPRIAVIGVAQTALPTAAIALVKLNLAIGGVLDFPKRLFSLDASLYDSRVGSFSVSGDAAFRMSFGDEPNFVFSIGGFNPTFKAPPNFPKLRRVSVDLGVNGNPSLTLSGYFALTSNTAQIGAAIRLYASGAGIELEGHVSFDALFVFSPFSFEADLDAGMSVSFHGVGIGIHFHGHLSGPSPYHVSGDVCVSILFWDACLSVSATFGESKRATLPTLDPWDPVGGPPELIGLERAVNDPRNWSGAPLPSSLSVVSLAETATDTPPIDPLGSATLRQKVVPLNQKLTRFGAFKPKDNDEFTRSDVTIGGGVPITNITVVTDKFARDTFKELSGAERLSAPPYDDMEAGFTLDPKVIHIGPANKKQIEFQTEVINGDTVVSLPNKYQLTQRHLRAMLLKSAAGLSGVRRTGLLKFVDPKGRLKVRLKPEGFVVTDACSRAPNLDVTASPMTHIQASLALEDHVLAHPEDAGRFAVVPGYELGL